MERQDEAFLNGGSFSDFYGIYPRECSCKQETCAMCNPGESATDSAQDSRLCRREGEVGEPHPESHRESRADTKIVITLDAFNKFRSEVYAVQERCGKLEAENRELRRLWSEVESRVVDLQNVVDGIEAVRSGRIDRTLNSVFGP